MYATVSESNVTAYVNNSFTFFKSAYYVSFIFITGCLSPSFHWIALGHADLLFPLIVVRKTNAIEEETK